MDIDVYADYLRSINPPTTSKALKTLPKKGGASTDCKNERQVHGCLWAPGVSLKIDGIKFFRKTMITCDNKVSEQIFVGKQELKMKAVEHCAMLEEEAMHLGTEEDVAAHVPDVKERKSH